MHRYTYDIIHTYIYMHRYTYDIIHIYIYIYTHGIYTYVCIYVYILGNITIIWDTFFTNYHFENGSNRFNSSY